MPVSQRYPNEWHVFPNVQVLSLVNQLLCMSRYLPTSPNCCTSYTVCSDLYKTQLSAQHKSTAKMTYKLENRCDGTMKGYGREGQTAEALSRPASPPAHESR